MLYVFNILLTVPQKPLNVSASVVSSKEVKVTWKLQGPKPGITTYHIKVYELVLNAEPAFVRGENVTGRYVLFLCMLATHFRSEVLK